MACGMFMVVMSMSGSVSMFMVVVNAAIGGLLLDVSELRYCEEAVAVAVAARADEASNMKFLRDGCDVTSFGNSIPLARLGAFSLRIFCAMGGMTPLGNESARVNSLWLQSGNISAPLV
jgi:hypothetical protein